MRYEWAISSCLEWNCFKGITDFQYNSVTVIYLGVHFFWMLCIAILSIWITCNRCFTVPSAAIVIASQNKRLWPSPESDSHTNNYAIGQLLEIQYNGCMYVCIYAYIGHVYTHNIHALYVYIYTHCEESQVLYFAVASVVLTYSPSFVRWLSRSYWCICPAGLPSVGLKAYQSIYSINQSLWSIYQPMNSLCKQNK